MQHDEIDNIQNGQRLPTLIMCMACFETATINPPGRLQRGSGDTVVNVCTDSGVGCVGGLIVSSKGLKGFCSSCSPADPTAETTCVYLSTEAAVSESRKVQPQCREAIKPAVTL